MKLDYFFAMERPRPEPDELRDLSTLQNPANTFLASSSDIPMPLSVTAAVIQLLCLSDISIFPFLFVYFMALEIPSTRLGQIFDSSSPYFKNII
jgi:hypothetical protein